MPERSDRYPNRTLEEACVAAGTRVICAWQIKAPKGTNIAWLEGLIIGSGFVIVQTLKGGGWQALSATPSNRTDATVADVLARCGVKPDTVRDAAPDMLAALKGAKDWLDLRDIPPRARPDMARAILAADAAIAKAEGR